MPIPLGAWILWPLADRRSTFSSWSLTGILPKLWTVSQGRQVLCVTHLPQIAAMADAEFTVEKRVEHERTYTSVLHLDDSGRRQELARLIGGSMITETTLAGAAELLRLADETKGEHT